MSKKIIGILICMLLITILLPTSTSLNVNKIRIENNIRIKDEKMLVIGKLTNLNTGGDYITFNAENIHLLSSLSNWRSFDSDGMYGGPQIKISKQKIGIVTPKFICAICRLILISTELSMSISSRNDSANEIVWIVTAVEGDQLPKANFNS